MMNPNAYGPPPTMQPMQQQQQQQQQSMLPPMSGQQYAPPGWPQQPGMQAPPPATSMPGGMPPPPPSTQQAAPPTQSNIMNGNYQQQLSQSMGAMTMNPMKQPPTSQQQPLSGAPTSAFNNANVGMPPQMPGQQTSLTNGPPPAQQPGAAPPSGANLNNNFNPYPNGTASRSPTAGTPGMPAPSTTSMSAPNPPQPSQTPKSMAGGNLPPAQNIPGAGNQMTVNSASLPGMPHMPPAPQKTAQNTPLMPPLPGQAPQQQQPGYPGAQPPTSQFQQSQQMPGRPGQGMMPPTVGGQQPPAPMQQPGMPPMPGQQQQPGFPPMPGQQQRGIPPMPGQQQPGMPPMPGQQQPGMPPMPGQQPPGMPAMQQPGMPPMPGYPPQPTQQNMPGYPPQPGQPPMPGGYPSQMMRPQSGQPMPGRPGYNQAPGGMYQQPPYEQQQKRLDPDQMPNPIQVMIENQRNAGGAFVTNQAGLLPPLVTTKYIVQDQGNSSPRFLRSSLYCVPATNDLLKTTALPFSLIVSPYARIAEGEYEPPIVDFGALGPIRCNRCKAYMSPNMQFIDAGRRFQCLMCKVSTEVPTEYFQHLDHTGQRVDKYERPELVLGTYEFLATKDYCRNNTPPEIPAFIFVIDVSYNTIKSGLVHLLCSQVKEILKNLPVDQGQDKSKMRVGFITYNSTVHFYNIKSSLAQPQMMVVGDVQDMFMPLLDGFLCNPEESEVVIDALMEQIPKMFVDTKETETILYPAIQAGLEALKASNCSGKLLVFNSSLPIAEAPGKLKNRDDRKLLGTDKEKTVLVPQCQAYNTLGQECVQNGCSVDLFLFNNSYIDIATIGQVARLSGGEVYKYTYFQADIDGKRLIADIIKNISRPIAFDAVMRVRTSAGVRATDFYGHFFMTNTTDVELGSVDCDKSVAIEIKHDDKLPPEENVYIQIALLFTSCSGQRRLRILNLALKATTTIAEVFKSCDLDAIMLFFAKQSCFKLMELTPKAVKDTLIHRSAQILACYRKHCTTPSSAGQLILPECLKLLPLYISCLLKNDAISGGSDMTLDDRSYVIQFILSMDLNIFVSYLYPRFLPIHNVDPDDTELPMSIRCTHDKMSEDGAYILENGVHFFIWLGQSLPQSFIQPLFGVQCTQQVNAERFAITGDTPLAQRIRGIIEKVMTDRTRNMRVTCVRQNDKLESVFRHFLIEDRGTDGSASYVDFLCHMHKEIKELLS
ncbi:COPII coat complex component secretory 24CD isoform 2-T2 [Cochliomyia hominivorax]